MIFVKAVFWASLACLVWTHVAYPAFAAGLARLRPRRVREAEIEPTVDGDRRRLQRGAGDRAPDREPARARLPARQARRSSSPPTPRPTAPRRSRSQYPACTVISNPRGGKVAAQDRAVRADRQRDRRLLGRERDLVARRAAQARARRSPIPRSPTSAASCASSTPTARTRKGVYWRYEMARARRRVARSARSPAATARSTRCAARTTSRSIRASATTSRCRT